MRVAIAAVSILAISGAASAATIKVPKDQPTIQAGVTAALTGDTVSIAKGVYFENVVVATPGITITGSGVTLDGTLAGVPGECLTINGANVVVKGITFRNGNFQIGLFGDGCQILNCTFQNAGSDAINGDGADGELIKSCKFSGMSDQGIFLDGTMNTVLKCTFTRAGGAGVELVGDGNRVESCTFKGMDDGNAVIVDGNGGFILKNKATFVDDDCYRVDGDGATVEGNKGDRSDNGLVLVNGNTAIVTKNTAGYCRGGIEVNGNTATITGNKMSNTGSVDAIAVIGDGFTVSGNTVTTTWDDADGISAASTVGLGLIEGNKVSDTAGYGYNLAGIVGVIVRNDTATRCGQDGKGGFNVNGTNNTLDGLKATEPEGPGILVAGNGNIVTDCTVKTSTTDGFRTGAGTGNMFDGCSATNCGGEGFDNGATDTTLTNSSFTKNRIDVANDGNFLGGLGTVTFTSGGEAVPPEVD